MRLHECITESDFIAYLTRMGRVIEFNDIETTTLECHAAEVTLSKDDFDLFNHLRLEQSAYLEYIVICAVSNIN